MNTCWVLIQLLEKEEVGVVIRREPLAFAAPPSAEHMA
jgi:hypothetical protein